MKQNRLEVFGMEIRLSDLLTERGGLLFPELRDKSTTLISSDEQLSTAVNYLVRFMTSGGRVLGYEGIGLLRWNTNDYERLLGEVRWMLARQ